MPRKEQEGRWASKGKAAGAGGRFLLPFRWVWLPIPGLGGVPCPAWRRGCSRGSFSAPRKRARRRRRRRQKSQSVARQPCRHCLCFSPRCESIISLSASCCISCSAASARAALSSQVSGLRAILCALRGCGGWAPLCRAALGCFGVWPASRLRDLVQRQEKRPSRLGAFPPLQLGLAGVAASSPALEKLVCRRALTLLLPKKAGCAKHARGLRFVSELLSGRDFTSLGPQAKLCGRYAAQRLPLTVRRAHAPFLARSFGARLEFRGSNCSGSPYFLP